MGISRLIWRGKKAILLLIVSLSIVGGFCFQALPVSIFPDLTAPRIIVTVDAGDTPIPAVEANITRPLENAVSGVTGITRVYSLTQNGAAELDVNFAWGTDMQSTLQSVNAKIASIRASLPINTKVDAQRLNPSVFPVMGYSLYSSTISAEALRTTALYTIRPRLLRVPGVQQINVLGGDIRDYRVEVKSAALTARGISLQDVQNALEKNNEVLSVGYYDKSFLHNEILVNGLFKNIADIENVTVAVKNQIPITIGQIATVGPGDEVRTIETSGDGHDAVLIDVIKQPVGNTIAVSNGITSAFEQVKSALPPGITISTFYDQSQIVRESQASVLESIIIGGVLALFVLMLFLGNIRTAAIVLVILPLTILITFGLMKALGQTLNIMTLGAMAIALGLVIDDGIVVVENIFHELERGLSRRAAISSGLAAITPAMLGSSITTMAAFLPLTFLNDLTGQFFGPLSLIMICTLGVSLCLALLLTPLLADYLLPSTALSTNTNRSRTVFERIMAFFPRQFDHVANGYSSILKWSLRHRAVVLLCTIPIALFIYVLIIHIQTGFFPEFDEGGFILDYKLPDGTSLAESSLVASKIESLFRTTPEIESWSRRTGAQLGFDITTQNVGDMSIRLKSKRTRDINAIMDDLRSKVETQFPSAQVDFHQILQDNIGDIAGSPSPVQIKIFGPNESELETLADQVDDLITKVPGVVDDFDGIIRSGPQTIVQVDTERAQRFGLTTDDIVQSAQAALTGIEPTQIQDGEQSVGVRLLLAHDSAQTGDSGLPTVPIESPVTGGTVQLGQLADIKKEAGAAQITRENQRGMIAVTAGLAGRDLGSATSEIQRQIRKHLQLPSGYTIEYGGLYESQQRSFSELGAVLAIAIVLVFTLLVIQFRSLRQAISLMLAAILSLIGVLFALFITGTPLNISSFTGGIMIVGIITENGIVLFAFFNDLRLKTPLADVSLLMLEAGRQRLRPILMTTIGAILALMPLALGLGAGAALQRPLAIAVIGGLSISILFTLIVAPVLFVTLERHYPSKPHAHTEAELDAIEVEMSGASAH